MKTKDIINKYHYTIEYSYEDKGFIGKCNEFPSLSHISNTSNAALKGIRSLIYDIIDCMKYNREKIPQSKIFKYCYICGTDWFHEIGKTKVFVFHSIEDLKNNTDCWKDCGIVKLKIQEEDWVQEPKTIDEWEKEETCETSC